MKLSRPLVIACTTFLGMGLIVAAPGPALPDLAAQTGSTLTAVGAIYSASAFGALLSIAVGGTLTDRFGQKLMLLAGGILHGLGALGYSLAGSLPLMLVLAFLTGVGQGTVNISASVLVARAYPEQAVTALNVLNLFFGVGAMTSPAFAGLTIGLGSTGRSGLWLGGGVMLAAALLLVPLLPKSRPSPSASSGQQSDRSASGAVLRSGALWVTGLMLLVYVGVENGMAAWATTYLTQTTTLDRSAGSLVTSGFWMMITVGRILAAGLGTRVGPVSLLRSFQIGAVGAATLLVLSTGAAGLSVAAVLLLGLSLGPVFPTTVGLATTAFPQAPGTASSVVISLASVGGMLLPPLQGAVMEGAGPRASIGMALAGTVLMVVLLQLSVKLGRRI